MCCCVSTGGSPQKSDSGGELFGRALSGAATRISRAEGYSLPQFRLPLGGVTVSSSAVGVGALSARGVVERDLVELEQALVANTEHQQQHQQQIVRMSTASSTRPASSASVALQSNGRPNSAALRAGAKKNTAFRLARPAAL